MTPRVAGAPIAGPNATESPLLVTTDSPNVRLPLPRSQTEVVQRVPKAPSALMAGASPLSNIRVAAGKNVASPVVLSTTDAYAATSVLLRNATDVRPAEVTGT